MTITKLNEFVISLRAELAQAKEKNLFLQTQVWDLDASLADYKSNLAAAKEEIAAAKGEKQ